MSQVVVALLQKRVCNSPAETFEATLADVRTAAARGAQIICTQELFLTPYFCQTESAANFDLAETIPGPATERLSAVAAELGVVLIASLFEKRMAGLYHNTAVIFDADGSLLGLYRKMHIPDDPEYYEKYYFTPGDLGYRAWRTRFGTIGVLVCWDQWFPEAARATALAGAQIVFYPTAIGWHDHEREILGAAQHDAWETVQRGHAVANGVFVCAVNRVGREGALDFWGQSFIADPFGRRVARAPADAEAILVERLDLGEIERTRRDWPFLRDRRIDSYDALLRRGP